MSDEKTSDVEIVGNEDITKRIESSRTMEQAIESSKLPGLDNTFKLMPDGHPGYGFPIGSVASFSYETGTISPAAIGYDINCGVRVLKTSLQSEEISEHKNRVANILAEKVPKGLVNKGCIEINQNDLDKILRQGASWMIENGYGEKADKQNCEHNGCMETENPFIPDAAIQKGVKQIGSLGSGNHFLEVQKVSKIFDEQKAEQMGLRKNQVLVMIHCGSRGLGYKTAEHYMEQVEQPSGETNNENIGYTQIQRELGQNYYESMKASANYAWANRQAITHTVRKIISEHFDSKTTLLYDHSHNIARIEKSEDGKKSIVHRKGSTRSLPPGSKQLPENYRETGQPVLLPGDMETGSYIMAGAENDHPHPSAPHGAGRKKSRGQSREDEDGRRLKNSLERKGVEVRASSNETLQEEAPNSYKSLSNVVKSTVDQKLCSKVSRQKPLINIKG